MKNHIHDPLDGNADPVPPRREEDRASMASQEELASVVQADVEAWERMVDAFRAEFPPLAPPPWLETRVMAEIEALPEPGPVRRLIRWLTAPLPLRLSPLWVGASGAALALVVWLGTGRVPHPDSEGTTVVYVEFALDAPMAASVAVAGDFDGWTGSFALEDQDGDGVWTGRVPLEPGVHAYMFLVDGSRWLTDPEAQRYADDGFGNRNAILAVAAPSA